MDNLHNHLDLVENNLLETNNVIAKQKDELTRTARELRKQMQTDLEQFEKFADQMNSLASKDSVKVIEKYIDILDPLKMLDKEDVEEIVAEKLKAKCDEVDIEYFTSPYDFESVDCVDPYVNVYKIGSGDITWVEIIEYIAKKGKPVMIATGASTMKDVVRAMNVLESINDDIILMQCNTNYTVNVNNFKCTNLNVLKTYKRRFPNAILGLSDHTQGHSTVLGAIALGACVFEKHFT
ncbi:N-acetylneuraminate synthase, partial [Candidatus Woesearchaeota archaeon]|nr:N-acetylneuraminate synthase [Candidatus Woesearchaeota archaeon]